MNISICNHSLHIDNVLYYKINVCKQQYDNIATFSDEVCDCVETVIYIVNIFLTIWQGHHSSFF